MAKGNSERPYQHSGSVTAATLMPGIEKQDGRFSLSTGSGGDEGSAGEQITRGGADA